MLDAADAGDAVAQAIVADEGPRARRAGAGLRGALGLPLEGTRVVLAGGVFEHPTERLADATMAELPGAVAVRHGAPPIAGALLLALDRIGVARRRRRRRARGRSSTRRKERRMGGIALEARDARSSPAA